MEYSEGRVRDSRWETVAGKPSSLMPRLLSVLFFLSPSSVGMLSSSAASGEEDLWLCAITSKEAKVDQRTHLQDRPHVPCLSAPLFFSHCSELALPSTPHLHLHTIPEREVWATPLRDIYLQGQL